MGKVFLKNGRRDNTVKDGFRIEKDYSAYYVTYADAEYRIKFKISKEQYEALDKCDSVKSLTIEERRDTRKILNTEHLANCNCIVIEKFWEIKEPPICYDMTIEW